MAKPHNLQDKVERIRPSDVTKLKMRQPEETKKKKKGSTDKPAAQKH